MLFNDTSAQFRPFSVLLNCRYKCQLILSISAFFVYVNIYTFVGRLGYFICIYIINRGEVIHRSIISVTFSILVNIFASD